MIFRFVLFLFSYGLCVISVSNLLLFLNYRTLGYSWRAVIIYILGTPELYLMICSLTVLFILIFDLYPSRFPFS